MASLPLCLNDRPLLAAFRQPCPAPGIDTAWTVLVGFKEGADPDAPHDGVLATWTEASGDAWIQGRYAETLAEAVCWYLAALSQAATAIAGSS